jgi:tetratricopeptide (TPR) repeat protein
MIDTQAHRRAGKAVTNFIGQLPDPLSDLAQQSLKDPNIFDFLTLTEPFHERELETGLVRHLEKFLLELGQGFAYVGRHGELRKAVPMLEETLEMSTNKLGTKHPNTLNVINSLAECYHATGQIDKALPMFERNLPLLKQELGWDHPATMNGMNNLAAIFVATSQLDKALPMLEQTLDTRRSVLGADHPDVLQSVISLAGYYGAAGQSDELTLELKKTKLGLDHPSTLASMNNLSTAYPGTSDATAQGTRC